MDESLQKRLEQDSLDLYLVRSLKRKVDKKEKGLTSDVKDIMIKQLNIRSYDGDKVQVDITDQAKPRYVKTEVAATKIPFNVFLQMISVDRKKFEEYLQKNKVIG